MKKIKETYPQEVQDAMKEGREVFDKFQMLRRIGEGGSGAVYKAFDTELERIVALKKINTTSQIQVQRVKNEAKAAARLNHSGIPKIFESGAVGDACYIAMQFIEGKSLKSMQDNVRRAAEIIRDVARILDYAHSQGIVHRDVKPSNIIIDNDGGVWLTDFGIAKVLDATSSSGLTTTGDIMGTPQFMSPEQAMGEHRDIDARADIFSLGSTLYFVTAGCFPFSGDNLVEVLQSIMSDHPKSPSQFNAAIPADLDAIVNKAMQKERGKRYQSAGDFADDLQRFLYGEQTMARAPGPIQETARRIFKRRRPIFLLLTLFLAVGVGFYFFRTSAMDGRINETGTRLAASLSMSLMKETTLFEKTPETVTARSEWPLRMKTTIANEKGPEVLNITVSDDAAAVFLADSDFVPITAYRNGAFEFTRIAFSDTVNDIRGENGIYKFETGIFVRARRFFVPLVSPTGRKYGVLNVYVSTEDYEDFRANPAWKGLIAAFCVSLIALVFMVLFKRKARY